MWPGRRHGWIGIGMCALAAGGLAFIVLPVLMMFPLSLESGPILRFPPQKLSLHWYRDYLASETWLASTILSLEVALCASAIATVTGTLAAVGLARTRPALRTVGYLVLMSPIFLPTIVVAIAVYGVYASLHLIGTPVALILAHAVLTLPLVALNVAAALATAPPSLEEAAMSLGASPAATLLQITLPLVRKGIAAGAIFAFLVSFDEVVIAMFLSGTQAVTLPKRMLDAIFYEISPMLAAISALLVVANVVLAAFALAAWRPSGRGPASPRSDVVPEPRP